MSRRRGPTATNKLRITRYFQQHPNATAWSAARALRIPVGDVYAAGWDLRNHPQFLGPRGTAVER